MGIVLRLQFVKNKDGHNGVDGPIVLLMRIVENEFVYAEDISVPENGIHKSKRAKAVS